MTTLKLGLNESARLVDGLLTGCHEPGTSHFELEQAFVSQVQAHEGFERARQRGFLTHEFGDLALILKAG